MTASKIIRPMPEYKDSYLDALREYHAEGRFLQQKIKQIDQNFEAFIDGVRDEKQYPHRVFQDWVEPVPETVVWLVKDDIYIGSAFIRHRLNWHLEKWGGHLSFIIRPSYRQKGFGHKMLQKVIPIVNHVGIDHALMTLAPDNEPAIRIVEEYGAVCEDETPQTEQFPARKRYWLDCR